jgi:hypothetical protein
VAARPSLADRLEPQPSLADSRLTDPVIRLSIEPVAGYPDGAPIRSIWHLKGSSSMSIIDQLRRRSVIVVVFLALFTLSSCSITTSTHIEEGGEREVKRTSFSIGTPFGTIGAKDDEDED